MKASPQQKFKFWVGFVEAGTYIGLGVGMFVGSVLYNPFVALAIVSFGILFGLRSWFIYRRLLKEGTKWQKQKKQSNP